MDSWPAPAKLNLFLHITGRRDDGYHNLQTLFQFLDFSDQLHFSPRNDGIVQRKTSLNGVAADDDLTVRAARLLQKHCNSKSGVDISVDKRIPMGGGLGGGSSDAATTLVALNRLWDLQLSPSELSALGLSLGADVPVFIAGTAAWAEGVGEILQAVDLPEPWYLVIFPQVTVSTAQLFNDPELTRDARPIKIRDYFAGEVSNVFEPLVRHQYPPVNDALQWLSNHARDNRQPPMMTGTGSCVFTAFDEEIAARQSADLANQQLPHDWDIIVARGCNESPLARRLKSGSSLEI
ncbi:MAG: 4-(cytidine 5'-diphospho)-2-C-methyl-D-erythritol kinase [Gammaproteobacteria bacterium]|jgi:4-diphosphocytidyl-2-C-methyl-D-erythritol kinase